VTAVWFVFWYHSPNFVDTPHISNISRLRVIYISQRSIRPPRQFADPQQSTDHRYTTAIVPPVREETPQTVTDISHRNKVERLSSLAISLEGEGGKQIAQSRMEFL
jgi:hypothetical protein